MSRELNLTTPTAPAGSPNVVVILLDDVGFGASSVVGGPVHMPTAERLAGDGLLYNRFHTTAVCSPTRASLLTGRNPHTAGVGAVLNAASADYGYEGVLRDDTATLAHLLKDAGYATGCFGKWHLTPAWETSQLGPFDRWPIGRGFDTFYGFLGGESDQYEPNLYRGITPVPVPDDPDYHFTTDMVTETTDWIRLQHTLRPEQPFFAYVAPGAAHAPLHVPAEWIEKYRGRFDAGWDVVREELLAGQKERGVAPADTALTPRPDGLPAWDSLSADEQRFAARLMEAHAGFLEHTDVQLGAIVDTLDEIGQRDNTIFIYVIGDNGSSSEAGVEGSMSYFGAMTGIRERLDTALAKLDQIGTKETYPQYPAGWAWAMTSPFQWVKTVASHFGGMRNPMVFNWPARVAEPGLRTQFGHVNDIVPTILEAAGVEAPESFRGIPQQPIDGVSLLYSLADAEAPEQHTTQYFEVFGHRSIYHEGWIASARHGQLPWITSRRDRIDAPLADDIWELYDTTTDFSQGHDLAAEYPDRLAELQELFLAEIHRTGVDNPQDTRVDRKPLPDLIGDRTELTFTSPVMALPELSGPMLSGRSWQVDADLTVPDCGAQGVILSLGSRHAGLVLWLDEDGHVRFDYRVFEEASASLTGPIAPGARSLAVVFTAEKPGQLGTPGTVQLLIDNTSVGSAHLARTQNTWFSFDEPLTVGHTAGSAVAGAHPRNYPLTCGFDRVHIDWGTK